MSYNTFDSNYQPERKPDIMPRQLKPHQQMSEQPLQIQKKQPSQYQQYTQDSFGDENPF